MDSLSNSVLDTIVTHFPELPKTYNPLTEFLELEIASPTNKSFGGLVIQTTANKDVWVRNYYKCSAYSVDTIDELIMIMKGVFADEIFWVIGFQNDEWIETTLINKGQDVETEKGVTYHVLSWSGNFDKQFTEG